MTIQIHHADCRDALAKMPADSVDTIICDPPYGLGFMGKKWDTPGALVEREADRTQAWDHVGGNHNPINANDRQRTRMVEGQKFQAWVSTWAIEALRVAKPGAHMLAFGGTRMFHRLASGLEEAGWEIRDCMMWLYGSGFPKSLNIGKAGAGDDWLGWGTALKPAWEPIVVAMKATDGTFAENAKQHGVAGFAIDAARIPHVTVEGGTLAQNTHLRASVRRAKGNSVFGMGAQETAVPMDTAGRWPANVLIDDAAAAVLDEQSGKCGAASPVRGTEASETTDEIYGKRGRVAGAFHGDTGGASRFFYCAKASRSERGEGNDHPTVKPLALMRYLCRLTKTPTGGIVLDPFVGSGTTLLAAQAEGRDAIGIEIDAHHYAIARRRCAWTSVKRPAKAG